jgi:HAMP domain-containing protein
VLFKKYQRTLPGMLVALMLCLCPAAYSQNNVSAINLKALSESNVTANAQATPTPAQQQGEVEQLRGEVKQLRSELERLRSLIEAKSRERAASAPSQPSSTTGNQVEGATQSTAAPENPGVAVATKAQGGDLSGAGNLLRTDRITIGGYGDFQFRQSSISERADGGGTPTFQNTRLVLGIAAVLAEKQNIVFNSEIEYEFGSREIDVEQAYLEWKVRPEFAFRGGIIVPALGRFNTFHDSYLNLTTIRPLINQFIVPSAYRDAGIGIRGKIKLPRKMRLGYEADLLNGMQGTNADDQPTPFSRLLGQSSAAEPGAIAFQDPNRNKAVVARLGLSPVQGLEFGASFYNGKFNKSGEAPQSATILFFDASYHRGSLLINGEYGRSNIVGGIPRKSTAPPVVDPNDPATVAELALFVAERSPGQDGFYVEGAYQFRPRLISKSFDEGGYLSPVVRYEVVRLDRTIPNFYLNRSRTTLGLNIAPSSTVIFKLDYLFNHTFGPVPRVPAGIGEAMFGVSPLPHLEFGRNGFTGSIAYVF